MLSIIFLILKIIGIILLVILLLFALILLVPIRYRFEAQADSELNPAVKARISWFLILIRVNAEFTDMKFWYNVRILGYQLLGNRPEFLELEEKRKEKKAQKIRKKEERARKKAEKKKNNSTESLYPRRKSSQKEAPAKEIPDKKFSAGEIPDKKFSAGEIPAKEIPEEELSAEETPAKEIPEEELISEESSGEDSVKTQKVPELSEENSGTLKTSKWKSMLDKFKAVKTKIMAVKTKITAVTGKIKALKNKIRDSVDHIKELWEEYHISENIPFLKEILNKTLRHILPRKLEGYVKYGFEDPATTGYITAVAAIFYPAYGKSFELYPYFDRKIMETECSGKGKIRLGYLLYIGIRLLLNKDIRKVVFH